MSAAIIRPALPTAAESQTVRGRHGVVEIYQRCDCEPDDADFQTTHFVVADVGVTCARGLLYVVCTECCCGENHQRCEDTHVHGQGHPWCPKAGTDNGRH